MAFDYRWPALVGGCGMTGAGGNFQADFGAAKGILHSIVIQIGSGLPKRFFGARLGFLCALYVDIFRALG